MDTLGSILKFVKLTNDFQAVARRVLVRNEDRYENDVEHSYQLALLSWYLIDSQKLELDSTLAAKYALLHDLVEVYAGDTYIYEKDKSFLNSKGDREAKTATQLQREFEEFPELHRLIHNYEQRLDGESKFVYALDNGRTWQKEGVTLQMLIDQKTSKVKTSPEVESYFDDLVILIRSKEQELFGN